MIRYVRVLSSVFWLLAGMGAADTAIAQKSGGILKIYNLTARPACRPLRKQPMFAVGPMMGVFNNLVVFDQSVKQNSLAVNRAGSGDRLVLERGRDQTDLSAAPRRQMA